MEGKIPPCSTGVCLPKVRIIALKLESECILIIEIYTLIHRCCAATIWNLWWNGRPVDHIQPYMHLKPFDLDGKGDTVLLCKAKFVIGNIVAYAGKSTADIVNMSIQEKDKVFEDGIVAAYKKMFPKKDNSESQAFDKRKFGDLKYVSLYDILKTHHNK